MLISYQLSVQEKKTALQHPIQSVVFEKKNADYERNLKENPEVRYTS